MEIGVQEPLQFMELEMPRFKDISGQGIVQFTAEEEAEADQQEVERIEEKRLNQYKKDRSRAYPSIPDQLDTIYHQGLDAWKAEIKAIKDKYPKP